MTLNYYHIKVSWTWKVTNDRNELFLTGSSDWNLELTSVFWDISIAHQPCKYTNLVKFNDFRVAYTVIYSTNINSNWRSVRPCRNSVIPILSVPCLNKTTPTIWWKVYWYAVTYTTSFISECAVSALPTMDMNHCEITHIHLRQEGAITLITWYMEYLCALSGVLYFSFTCDLGEEYSSNAVGNYGVNIALY